MNLNEKFIEKIQTEFSKKHILVVGDLMVDEYIIGKVTRISPEAPVPVLNFKEKRLEAGGASNVAHNIRTLGSSVSVIGTAATDEQGNWLRGHLLNSGIVVDGVYAESGARPQSRRATPQKASSSFELTRRTHIASQKKARKKFSAT